MLRRLDGEIQSHNLTAMADTRTKELDEEKELDG